MKNKLLAILSLFLFIFLFFPSFVKAATYTVSKTVDTNDGTCDSDCSIREAIAAANSNSGNDIIEFNIPSSDGGYVAASGSTQAYWLITTTSTLTLSDDSGVYINGYTQTGASRNTSTFGSTLNTILTIQVFINTTSTNLNITGNNNHIAGLNLRTLNANITSITVNTSSSNWFEGNFFGSDITGSTASNASVFDVAGSSASNIFGTNGNGNGDVGEFNLFAGAHTANAIGGYISLDSGDSNVVAGNYMGTDKTGRVCTTKTMSHNPLQISSNGNRIGTNYDGTSDASEANIIGCTTNSSPRAYIRVLTPSANNVIQGNYIGVSPAGDKIGDLPGLGLGAIQLTGTTGTIIKGNYISNADYGILVAATSVLNNTFSQNKIYGNTIKEISLSGTTNLVNDSGDIDSGANYQMNTPVIESAVWQGGGYYKIKGFVDGNSSEAPFTIEVCKSSNHSSGYGGCSLYLGSATTTNGSWELTVSVPGDSEGAMSSFTSLATNTNGSTSEYSQNIGGKLSGSGSNSPSNSSDSSYSSSAPLSALFISKGTESSIIISGSLKWDAYFDVVDTPKPGAFRIPNTTYWQVGPKKEIWWKASFNDAKILPSEVLKPYILIFKYDPNTIEPSLKKAKLKIAYSTDGTKWKLLSNTIHNTKNNTFALVTKQGGFYMLVGGY